VTTATFKSHNKALRFLTLLTRNGIAAKLVSLDSGFVEKGCSYGVRLNRKHIKKAESIGIDAGTVPERWL